ncbi:MAG: RNA methyltransferase [Deltaproteobacteria bacterium]|nr:RNA methyltransferase [Deltaproteobacteria bacterium]
MGTRSWSARCSPTGTCAAASDAVPAAHRVGSRVPLRLVPEAAVRLDRPTLRIVLLRPRVPENLGAVARAMKNFGFGDWALVEPATHDFRAAGRVAVHAEELLDRPRVAATLEEVIADCTWVVGTSSRKVRGKRQLSPQEVGAEVALRGGRTALVFGDERGGLSNADADRCHDLSTISAEAEQPSLNLAQAVLLYLWEVRRAAEATSSSAPSAASAEEGAEGGATGAELSVLETSLREALLDSGFLRGPERHAVRDLLGTLRRSRLSRREARLWIAALRARREG